MDNFNTSLVTFFFLLILSQAKAFDITTILGHYPSFRHFNSYLIQTGVSAAINSRQAITVLVVENNNLLPLKGKSRNVVANIMRLHVLLDYYDVQKLQNLPHKTVKAPTLFQITGLANNELGFLNMTELGTGNISLGSAAKGEALGSNLLKSITSEPFNISILQISNLIIPLGIDPSASPPRHAPAPSPRHDNHSGPLPTPNRGAPTPSSAPSASRPSAAPAHGSGNVPVPQPAAAETPAEAPAGGASADDAPAPAPAPADDHDSSSASSVLGVLPMLNLFLVFVI